MSSEDITNQTTSQDSVIPPSSSNATSLNRHDDSSSNSLPSDFLTSSVPLPQPPENPANTVPSKTLWMGDLEAWWDEEHIGNLWAKLDKHVEVKVIKPKHNLLMHQLAKTNGQGIVNHSGYCFIEFDSPDLATDALSLNGTTIPDSNNKTFRLNWASAATLDSQVAQTPEYSLFVGDLSAGTTEAHLLALFQSHFNSIKTVRVMTDPSSGLSRCFGFVRFSNEEDRRNALVEMNGKWLGGRQIRVALATPKHQNMSYGNSNSNNNGSINNQNQYQRNSHIHNHQNQHQHQHPLEQSMYVNTINGPMPAASIGFYPHFNPNNRGNINSNMNQGFNDLNNTTVFVGGLANGLNEDTLLALFEPFGPIANVKVPPGKGCGFVKFAKREDAENAIESMQGFVIGGSRVRLSWGRPSNKNFPRQPHMYHSTNMANIPLVGSANPNMNNIAFNNNMNSNNFPNHNGNMNSDSNEDDEGNMMNHMPNVAMFNGQSPGQPVITRPMFDYGQGMPQHPPPPNVPSVISPNQLPQQIDSYPENTPQGTHPTLVGIPAGMPPPFIYDPYFAVQQQGNHMSVVPDDSQGVPQPMSHASTGMMEVPKGVVPIHGAPQQYAIDQNGQYMILPSQQFPANPMVHSPGSAYDDSTSNANGSEHNTNE